MSTRTAARTRTSFDELARDVAPLRQCAEGRRAGARRPRRGVSVAVAGTAGRASGGVSLRPGVGAAVRAVRRGRAGISSRRIPAPRPSSPTRAAGRSSRKSATGCRIWRISMSSADALPAGTKSFWSSLETASAEFATVDTSADDPAIIIYTSGTTGNPKGALHAHRVLLGHLPNVEMVHDFMPKPGDVMWTPADWAWIGGLFDALFPAWYHGVPVVGHRAQKVRAAGGDAADGRSRRAQRVPAADRAEADAAGRRQTSRRAGCAACFTGGESLGAELLDWVRATFGIDAHEVYGQTECNLVVGSNSKLFPIRPGSMGKATPGFDVRIVNEQRRGIAARRARHHRRAPAQPVHHARILEKSGSDREEICRRIPADRRSRRAG